MYLVRVDPNLSYSEPNVGLSAGGCEAVETSVCVCVAVTLLCGVYGGLVAVLSVVSAHSAVITGHVPVLLIDSAAPQRGGGQHPQRIRVHVLVDTLAERRRRCHLLLEVVVCCRRGRHRCRLGAQHVRRHVSVAVRVSVEGAVRGRVAGRRGGGEEGGEGGGAVGLMRRLGRGEVAAAAQARELEEGLLNAEHLARRCCHLVGREEQGRLATADAVAAATSTAAVVVTAAGPAAHRLLRLRLWWRRCRLLGSHLLLLGLLKSNGVAGGDRSISTGSAAVAVGYTVAMCRAVSKRWAGAGGRSRGVCGHSWRNSCL